MTLLETCEQIAEKIESLQRARQNQSQRSMIQARYEEWMQVANGLDSGRKILGWLERSPADVVTAGQALAAVKALAAQAGAKLTAGGSAGSLVEQDLWKRLLASGGSAIAALEVAARQEWQTAIATISQVESPACLHARLPQTPDNMTRMPFYESKYKDYCALVAQEKPKSANDLANLRLKVSELVAIIGKLEFDVPPAVERFFRAVGSGGADLELLSEPVLAWLRENHQLKSYIVKTSTR